MSRPFTTIKYKGKNYPVQVQVLVLQPSNFPSPITTLYHDKIQETKKIPSPEQNTSAATFPLSRHFTTIHYKFVVLQVLVTIPLQVLRYFTTIKYSKQILPAPVQVPVQVQVLQPSPVSQHFTTIHYMIIFAGTRYKYLYLYKCCNNPITILYNDKIQQTNFGSAYTSTSAATFP